MVNGSSPGPAPKRPRLGPAAHGSPDPAAARMAPTETPQERTQRGRRLDHTAQHLLGPASAQRVGVVDAVATGQGRRHQGQHLVPSIRTTRCISQVNVAVHQFAQTQVMGQRDRQDQSGVGHQAVIVEGDLDALKAAQRGSIRWVLLVPGWFGVSQTIIPEAGSTFSTLQHDTTRSSFRWIGA